MEAPKPANRGDYLRFSRLSPAEFLGIAAALLLFVSLWLPWFSTSENPNSRIDSAGIGPHDSASAWQTFRTLDWILLAACTSPFTLSWILARGHQLSWRPGEINMVFGAIAMVLVLCNGIILGKPDPGIELSLSYGYFMALLGTAGLIAAGFLRQARYGAARKPPGVL